MHLNKPKSYFQSLDSYFKSTHHPFSCTSKFSYCFSDDCKNHVRSIFYAFFLKKKTWLELGPLLCAHS